MKKEIKEIKDMYDILMAGFPTGADQRIIEAILSLDKRLSKLEKAGMLK